MNTSLRIIRSTGALTIDNTKNYDSHDDNQRPAFPIAALSWKQYPVHWVETAALREPLTSPQAGRPRSTGITGAVMLKSLCSLRDQRSGREERHNHELAAAAGNLS